MFVQSRKYSTMVVTMHRSAVTGVVWCQAMYRYGTAREKSAETGCLWVTGGLVQVHWRAGCCCCCIQITWLLLLLRWLWRMLGVSSCYSVAYGGQGPGAWLGSAWWLATPSSIGSTFTRRRWSRCGCWATPTTCARHMAGTAGTSGTWQVVTETMTPAGPAATPATAASLLVLPTLLRLSWWCWPGCWPRCGPSSPLLLLLLMVWMLWGGMGSPPRGSGCWGSRGVLSQGWVASWARLGRAAVSTVRHCRTKSWHSPDTRYRNRSSAEQICSSLSKGMSPQTMSYRRMPRLHTVALSPL